MEKVTVIIPIHNIRKRGLMRVFNSCYSLINQDNLHEIIIVNSSCQGEINELSILLSNLKTDKIQQVQVVSNEFNKPKLLNIGIGLAETKWVMCTDCDYVFKNDFLDVCALLRDEKKILFKEVKMLPRLAVNTQMIDKWLFPKCDFNEWGHLANGACQYATKEFFTINKYPEQMIGFGAMDNIMAYIAVKNGLQIHWITQSEIVHQHHNIEKFATLIDSKNFKRNQDILSNYIKENNLPILLRKTR